VVIVLAIVWTVRTRRQQDDQQDKQRGDESRPPGVSPPPVTPPRPSSEDIPTFRVVALGLEGAGKTVLLASQSHKLRPAADRRYFFAGDLDQNLFLASIYMQVRDTSALWPKATRIADTRRFLFDCKASDPAHEERTIFRISYLDYAGEVLKPGADSTAVAGELNARIADADALLVIIDGRRVLQLLRDERAGRDYFDHELWPLLALAQQALCPIQLIVTKWDLLRSFGAPVDDDELLRQVSRRLTTYGDIRQLVHAHCQRQEEVRLIPVSAVGPDFVELHADGTVAKRAGGTLDPINVDVPLCAVIPAVLKRVERELDPSLLRDLDDDISRSPLGDVASIVSSVLNSQVGMLVRNALSGLVGDAVVKLFIDLLVRRSKSRATEPPRDDDETQTARLRADVIKDMERVVEQFEDRLPSSLLCRRRPR
jgi:hypothetical protein